MIQSHASRRRGGFTLLELLVVMTIITIFAGLSLGVYFRVRKTQTESAAQLIVNKIQSQHDQQWKAAIDNARDDVKSGRLPGSITQLALDQNGNEDARRAAVIWTKIQLKLEFPQNFWEATLWPGTTGLGLQAKPSYTRAIVYDPPNGYNTGQIPIGQITKPTNSTPDDQLHAESAALLYMALTQGRRGQATGWNPTDVLGPHAVGEVPITWYGVAATFKCFVDTWGQPIAFIRWPTGAPMTHELNVPGSPYATTNKLANFNGGNPLVVDPQDPELTLLLGWSAASQKVFNDNIHPLNPNQPQNLIPVIMSAGPDKSVQSQLVHYGVTRDFARVDSYEDDNLYGYRSRGVGRK